MTSKGTRRTVLVTGGAGYVGSHACNALAYVGESVADPLRYYRNNVDGTIHLLEAMRDGGQFPAARNSYSVRPVNA